MRFNPEEVSWVIQQEVEKYEDKLDLESIGRIVQVGDGIARVWGLSDVMMSELVTFENGARGMVLNLEMDNVGVILLGSSEGIIEQSIVNRTGRLASIAVGEELIGRVINPLGDPLDGKGPILTDHYRPLEFQAPGVTDRQPVTQPIQTGITAIDAMIPIGRGQRELIIGDRQTGKTTIILDAILNQKGQGLHCIYVAIGQKNSTVAQIVAMLEEHGAMEYTTVICAAASDPASLQYLAPYAGAALGEYFMYKGEDAVCFYDDLSKHAQAYRELSLLLRRPPGREAYPGDVFYLHSRLLERAAKLSVEKGGGSLTAIPVIETQANDVSAYIPTNVISITDGQIYLESDLFYAGIRPAINVGLSVSRVGGKAQTKAMKKVAQRLRLDLAQYRELAAFTQFGSDLDETTMAQLRRGERMVEILKQDKFAGRPLDRQIIMIFAGTRGYLDEIPIDLVKTFGEEFLVFVDKEYPDVAFSIMKTLDLDDKTNAKLEKAAQQFKEQFIEKHEIKK